MSGERPTRRRFLRLSAAGTAVLGLGAHAGAWMRSLVANLRYEPPKRRKLGDPTRFPPGRTYVPEDKLFVIRDDAGLRVLSARCPHLGCTVRSESDEYHCPCHGSRFDARGGNRAGPAPRPLSWFHPEIAPSGELVVDTAREVSADYVCKLDGGRR